MSGDDDAETGQAAAADNLDLVALAALVRRLGSIVGTLVDGERQRERRLAALEAGAAPEGMRLLREIHAAVLPLAATFNQAESTLQELVASGGIAAEDADELPELRRRARAVVDARYAQAPWDTLNAAIGDLADLVGGGSIEDQTKGRG